MGMVFLLVFWLAFCGGTVYTSFLKEELPAGEDSGSAPMERY